MRCFEAVFTRGSDRFEWVVWLVLFEQWANFISLNPYLVNIFRSVSAASQDDFLAFLLNPTTHPEVLSLAHQHGKRAMEDVSFLTRSWVYEHHPARFRALGLYSCL